MCLEKRKLVSGVAQVGVWGPGSLWWGSWRGEEQGGGPWAMSGQGDQALCSFRPRGPRAWIQPVACPCIRRWVGRWDQAGMGGQAWGPG